MSVAAPTRRAHRLARKPRAGAWEGARRRPPERAPPPTRAPEQPVDLEALGDSWWAALDAADSAVRAASFVLPLQELGTRRSRLTHERESTVQSLDSLARVKGLPSRFGHLLISRSNLKALLGLPSCVSACVFNLDGVLIGSASIHAAAWAETFDEFLARPAPDILLAACRELGIPPKQTAVFETSSAGVAAGRAGGFGLVIGVDPAGKGEALRTKGADLAISGLAELLEQKLAA
jgi:hypothetical protein